MNFAQSLTKAAQHYLNWSPVNIIDTGRNGVVDARQDCANWCNPRDTGAGAAPTTHTGNDLVDALFWLKTPGESDGCTQTTPDGTQCLRYDTMCGSSDSIGSRSGEPRAPEAGKWFDYQVKMLAANAHFDGPVLRLLCQAQHHHQCHHQCHPQCLSQCHRQHPVPLLEHAVGVVRVAILQLIVILIPTVMHRNHSAQGIAVECFVPPRL